MSRFSYLLRVLFLIRIWHFQESEAPTNKEWLKLLWKRRKIFPGSFNAFKIMASAPVSVACDEVHSENQNSSIMWGEKTKEIKNIISTFTRLKHIMYSIKEKCETTKTPEGQTVTWSKTVTPLKFKTVFAITTSNSIVSTPKW